MSDEQLIELVKGYPVLYDMSLAEYRDHNVRYIAWKEIAEQMNTPVEDIKNKWGNLRNCFTNAMKRRRKKSGQAATPSIPWKYEKQMKFLLPFVKGRRTITNSSPNEVYIKDEDSNSGDIKASISRTSVVRTSTPASFSSFTSRHTNKNSDDKSLLKEMVNVIKSSNEMNHKGTTTEMDETDYFFLSMSKQLKKLPKIDQSKIKFQLHKLIHESEMKMLSDC